MVGPRPDGRNGETRTAHGKRRQHRRSPLSPDLEQRPTEPPPLGDPRRATTSRHPSDPYLHGEAAMPRGKRTGKTQGKPAHQLLFSEALRQQKHPPAEDPAPLPRTSMADDTQGATMDRILQEISAVSRKLEGMDSAMEALTAETRSMCLDIAGFQSQISGLDQRVATVETQVASWTAKDQELLHLRSKLTDLEDRSRRNNVRFLGFPEGIEGADIFSYLRETLPKLQL
ncbi:hypothetical protein NDU88_000866 [Pleurodeles waltl]|uniref:Uncharacterized protein n=1 Tax=Pleurodeles waltl TaxID=8319 RepID=A0AAV7VXH0_PLEWA|nr:hypothetical protein NDU88_000866 [Pleurodeles waltl]